VAYRRGYVESDAIQGMPAVNYECLPALSSDQSMLSTVNNDNIWRKRKQKFSECLIIRFFRLFYCSARTYVHYI